MTALADFIQLQACPIGFDAGCRQGFFFYLFPSLSPTYPSDFPLVGGLLVFCGLISWGIHRGRTRIWKRALEETICHSTAATQWRDSIHQTTNTTALLFCGMFFFSFFIRSWKGRKKPGASGKRGGTRKNVKDELSPVQIGELSVWGTSISGVFSWDGRTPQEEQRIIKKIMQKRMWRRTLSTTCEQSQGE